MSPECVVPIALHLATVVVLAVLAYRRSRDAAAWQHEAAREQKLRRMQNDTALRLMNPEQREMFRLHIGNDN